jgi:hypothetical protein
VNVPQDPEHLIRPDRRRHGDAIPELTCRYLLLDLVATGSTAEDDELDFRLSFSDSLNDLDQ